MSRRIRASYLACLVLLPASAASLAVGCGGTEDELPRHAVTGTVTLKGEPLKTGTIQFQPSSPGAATAGGAGIVDGHYSIAQAEGLVPGNYRVTITGAPAAAAPAGLPGDSPPPPKEPIPAKYNAQTILTAEVKSDDPNKFDFDLQAK